MDSSRSIPFIKMNGLGNDFVMFDFVSDIPIETHQRADASAYPVRNRGRIAMSTFLHQHRLHSPITWEFPKGVMRKLSNRQQGVGCDQLVVMCEGGSVSIDDVTDIQIAALRRLKATCMLKKLAPDAPVPVLADPTPLWVAVRIFNGADGDEVGMCGNALRCIAVYWYLKSVLEFLWNAGADGTLPTEDEILSTFGQQVLIILPFSMRWMPCVVEDMPLGDIIAAFYQRREAWRNAEVYEDVREQILAECVSVAQLATCDVRVELGYSDQNTFPAVPSQVNGDNFGGAFPLAVESLVNHLSVVAPSVAQLVRESVAAVYAVSVGNPHCVIIAKSLESMSTEEGILPTLLQDSVVDLIGAAVNQWLAVYPIGCNIEFIFVTNAHRPLVTESGSRTICNARMRVFERGAGRTLACGSGACAAGVAIHAVSMASKLPFESIIEMDGGELRIVTTVPADDISKPSFVVFSGGASLTYIGSWFPIV
jgi:diaminopimelate epimerase